MERLLNRQGCCRPHSVLAVTWLLGYARTKASVRSQLMQVYVQKSTRTTFPARPPGVSGDEFSQPVAPSNPGRRSSTGTGPRVGGGARRRGSRPATSGLEDGVRERLLLRKEPDATRDHPNTRLRISRRRHSPGDSAPMFITFVGAEDNGAI
jgi:hypothetical protein